MPAWKRVIQYESLKELEVKGWSAKACLSATGTEEDTGGGRRYRVECSPVSVNGDVGRIELIRLEMSFVKMPKNTVRVFCNGFQSWTESREYHPQERMKPVRPLPGWIFGLRNYGDYHFKPYPAASGRFHSYTYTYLRLSGGFPDR